MTRPPRIAGSELSPALRAGDLPDDGLAQDALQDEGEESSLPELDLDIDIEAAPDTVRAGVEIIRAHEKHAPNGPGVYRMIGADGEVLYVGKARSIKKRIGSYARGQWHSNRIARMISLTSSMVFMTTATETEALLLEANLIKQLKPRFNVLLRDDKSFPYILVTADHRAPQITKHRGARNRKGSYFGPFASVWAVNRTIKSLQRAFLLRSCSDSYFENRTRPCLLWQIKRCAGPCTNEVPPDHYSELVQEARDFLSGKSRKVREALAAEMNEAAETLEFEKAARLRDRIAALSAIQGTQDINPRTVEEADVFAIVEQAGQFAIEVFFFRNYQNWGNRTYFPRADKSLSLGEVLDSFLAQFYEDKPAARCVLLSHEIENREILGEALTQRAGRKVEVSTPQRGERRELVEHASRNAKETLGRKLADSAAQVRLLDSLAQAFGIEKQIRRVEVYDNSHIMGTNAVGGMVVAGPGGFMKSHYRTFNIKNEELTPGDDYAMMREVLSRRFARLLKEEGKLTALSDDKADSGTDNQQSPVDEGSIPSAAPNPNPPESAEKEEAQTVPDPSTFPSRPDLILIDGGIGQFEAARSVLKELGVEDVSIASIAKGPDRNAGRETFFVEGREPFKLEPRDPALYFVQRLRDEAHRFAIGTHRARRKKDFTKNPLDEIAGIGPIRKRALLNAFGTAKAISRAALADLEKVPGVNAATAKLVYDYFHDRK
jgi:excinuclease ABC subunit C